MLLQSSVFSLIPNDWPNCLVTHQPRLKMNHIETERLCAFKWLVPSLPEVAGADVSASLCQHSKPMRFHQWLLGPSWRSITTHGCLLFWWLTFRSTLWLGFLSRPYTCKNKPQPRVYVGYTILKFQDFLFRHIHRSLILEWFNAASAWTARSTRCQIPWSMYGQIWATHVHDIMKNYLESWVGGDCITKLSKQYVPWNAATIQTFQPKPSVGSRKMLL